MPAPAIEVNRLSHAYGSRRALDDVSFELTAGQSIALLGPNGSGKTTLFRILSTLLTPDSGSARVAGFDVLTQAPDVRRSIGVTFQSPSIDRRLTVRENLIYHGRMFGLNGAALRRRTAELLDAFRIAARADDVAEVLSGGLRRRVEIAKSMMHRPAVLLLDEPSTGLDPGARDELRRLFEQLNRDGVSILFTTHLMEEADPCQRVAIMNEGRLVAIGPPRELCAEIGGDVLTFEAREPRRLAQLIGPDAVCEAGVVRVERPAAHRVLAEVIDAFDGRIDAVHVGRPTLADVFRRHTGRGLENGAEEN
ncbi:MAG: Vitamin B12 import ATP-binding protein BtuD [Phycisphaerae bacterium]|nr:Vitamin B12 import ATP-binding protein BtuD [Phycisphaerae bacterium]